MKGIPENVVRHRVRAIFRRPAEVGESVDGGVGAVVAPRVEDSGGSAWLSRPHFVALLNERTPVAGSFIFIESMTHDDDLWTRAILQAICLLRYST